MKNTLKNNRYHTLKRPLTSFLICNKLFPSPLKKYDYHSRHCHPSTLANFVSLSMHS